MVGREGVSVVGRIGIEGLMGRTGCGVVRVGAWGADLSVCTRRGQELRMEIYFGCFGAAVVLEGAWVPIF